MVDGLTWVKVPVLELAYGHLGRHIKATDGGITVNGVLVALMLGKHDDDGFVQMVVTTDAESVVTINTHGPDNSVELSLERAT